MNDKRKARIAYYEGIKQATLDQFEITEDGLRKLQGMEPEQLEKIVADVHKRHEKLLKRVDQYLQREKQRDD